MATGADTFQRKEKKYLITKEQAQAMKEGLASRMRLDDYDRTRIDSLYLDTRDHDLISRSLEKPLYKEKLRIRSYGPFSEALTVFIEIKKKFKGIVYKRRVVMATEAARAYLAGMSFEEAQRLYPIDPEDPEKQLSSGQIQIAREIDAFFARHPGLEPAMLISCMREAWCPLDPEDADCVDRITFDEDIEYVDFLDSVSTMRRSVASKHQVVMEIKCAGGYPMWLCALLSSCDIHPRSFSKYGNAYKRTLVDSGNAGAYPSSDGKVVVDHVPSNRNGHSAQRLGDVLLGAFGLRRRRQMLGAR